MINDVFTASAVAGIVANIPVVILSYVLYRLNINKVFVWHIAATMFIENKDVNTAPGIILGAISDFVVAGFKGVIIGYLLYFTGFSFYLFKGLTVSLLFWILVFGFILRMKITGWDPVDPATNLVHLAWHIILGLLTAYFIVHVF